MSEWIDGVKVPVDARLDDIERRPQIKAAADLKRGDRVRWIEHGQTRTVQDAYPAVDDGGMTHVVVYVADPNTAVDWFRLPPFMAVVVEETDG